MARPPKPWYRAARDQWCVHSNGKCVVLAKGKSNYNEAFRRFLILTSASNSEELPPPVITAAQMCEKFLEFARSNLKRNTVEWHSKVLKRFSAHFGQTDASTLGSATIFEFLDKHPSWGTNTRRCAIKSIRRAWSWGAETGKIPESSVPKTKAPKAVRRELIPDASEVKSLLAGANPRLAEILTFIDLTGCRPGEACMIQRHHVSLDAKEVRFRIGEDKTSGRTGKPRVIHLSDQALELIVKVLARRTIGHAFRKPLGAPWTSIKLSGAVQKVRIKMGISDAMVPYGLRHRWITDALAGGMPLSVVAELAGTSPQMIANTYSHLSDRKDLLIKFANSVRLPSQSDPSPQNQDPR